MINTGVSTTLWVPDEEILASSLNIRERKYNANYYTDNFGADTGLPIFSFSTQGVLYGSGIKYGFTWYGSKLNAGLVVDSIEISFGMPTLIIVDPSGTYSDSDLYGFIEYGSDSIEDIFSIGDLTPSFSVGSDLYLYGNGDYGFMAYGVLNALLDTISFSTASIVITPVSTVINLYGSNQYGFCVYVA